MQSQAEETRSKIVVGGYQFEPFVETGEGVSPAFVAFLNDHQSEFLFEFREIPARRRYELMADARIDMILFEMPVWGWKGRMDQVEVTAPLLTGAEVLVARVGNIEAGLDIFRDVRSKKLALTLGYHYGFAEYNSDPDHLKSNFDVVFSEFQRHALRHLLAGAVDVAVVNNAFLEREFLSNPGLTKRLLISSRPDQRYMLPVMVRKGGPVSVAAMTAILRSKHQDGSLRAFFEKQAMGKFFIFQQ